MSENSVKTVYLIISGYTAVQWESNRTQPVEILDPPKQTLVLEIQTPHLSSLIEWVIIMHQSPHISLTFNSKTWFVHFNELLAEHRSDNRTTADYLAVLRHHYVVIRSRWSQLSDPCALTAATGPTKVLTSRVGSEAEPDSLRVRLLLSSMQPFTVDKQELRLPVDRRFHISTSP